MATLFVVGTPIGNLNDMSYRAIETLKSVDFIAAEDTRVTAKLLNHFDIKKPMTSYYEHNLRERGQYIVDRIVNGENCAIVSDAGMPCISDPGEDLVRLCAEAEVKVEVVPGPSAVISALAISSLKTGRFTFEGFLSVNKKSRRDHLEALLNEQRTMIFYEAPHKLINTLTDLQKAFGNRKIAVCRELTKLYEQVLRVTIDGAIEHFTKTPPKGEFVLVIEGKPIEDVQGVTLEEAIIIAVERVGEGEKATEVSKELAKAYGLKKSDIYNGLVETGENI